MFHRIDKPKMYLSKLLLYHYNIELMKEWLISMLVTIHKKFYYLVSKENVLKGNLTLRFNKWLRWLRLIWNFWGILKCLKFCVDSKTNEESCSFWKRKFSLGVSGSEETI